MAKFDDLQDKEAGKVRVILTFLDDAAQVYDARSAETINGWLEVEMEVGLVIAFPASSLKRVDIDSK